MSGLGPMIDPIHVVNGEVQNVMAAMRLNRRWASNTSQNGNQSESPLLRGFKTLLGSFSGVTDLHQLDTMVFIEPFLEVIRSEETSGPITGVALSSVHKFLNSVIKPNSPNASRAMAQIAEAATHCRFEATDPDSDEVVLMRILQVLLACVRCPSGLLLTEDVVYEIVRTCFRMTVQSRLSELLRRSAEATLLEMVQILFTNYNSKDVLEDEEEAAMLGDSQTEETETSSVTERTSDTPSQPTSAPLSPVPTASNPPSLPSSQSSSGPRSQSPAPQPRSQSPAAALNPPTTASPSLMFVNTQGIRFEVLEGNDGKGRRYGEICLARIFEFIVDLVDASRQDPGSDEVRLLGSSLLNSLIEIRGSALINISPILKTIQKELCKHLLMNMHTRNISLFTTTLRIFFSLYLCAKQHLKLQLEAFFTSLLARIMDNKVTPYEQQELALECLVEFCRIPDLMVDLYVNYDCDLYCSNLFDNLCKFLYKNAFPVSGSLFTIHLLSLDGLLSIVQCIASRLDLTQTASTLVLGSSPTVEELRKRKQQKTLMMTAAEHFNRSAKEGMEFLKTNKIISDTNDVKGIAHFLRYTPRLDKGVVGELLGKKSDEFTAALLRAYIETFDFTHQKFHVSIRQFMESYRVPGEAQIIGRVLEAYAEKYHSALQARGDLVFANPDVVYLLCYSIIMLNVDQHSPKVKYHMTLDEYANNVSKINDKKDLPRDLISEIYHDIRTREIRIPEEFPSGDRSANSFSDLMQREGRVGEFIVTHHTGYDKDIFAVIWAPIIAAISVVFDTTGEEEERILKKTLDGFYLCAKISAHYHLSDGFDNLVISLCKFSTLLSPPGENPLATFGRDGKAQQATIAVFSITRQHGDHLREGWRNILNCIISLFQMDQLSSIGIADMCVDFEGPILPTKSVPLRGSTSGSKAAGLLSPFGLLGTAAWFGGGELIEAENEEDRAAEEVARKVMTECNIRQLITSTATLNYNSLLFFIKALVLASVRPKKNATPSPHNERVSMFCLDLLTNVTIINHDRVILFWVIVYDHLKGIISGGGGVGSLLEKAVLCLMFLCINLFHKMEITDQIIATLQLVASLEPVIVEPFADKLMLSLLKLVERHASLLGCSPAAAQLVFQMAENNATSSNPSAAARAYDIVGALLNQGFLRTDNYESLARAFSAFLRPGLSRSPVAISAMEDLDVMFSRVLTLLELKDEPKGEHGEAPGEASRAKSFLERAKQRKRDDRKKEAWSKYWVPILRAYCGLCRDPRSDVRNHAMTHLQRALLSPYLDILTPQGWFVCFEEIMFPLLTELLKPPGDVDSSALEETRLRAIVLLSKIFLQNLHTITQSEDFHTLWLKILQFIEVYMKADNSELLAEAVPESLKNILLVMSEYGTFKPGAITYGQNIWDLTWTTIDAFCPTLKDDIIAKVEPGLAGLKPTEGLAQQSSIPPSSPIPLPTDQAQPSSPHSPSPLPPVAIASPRPSTPSSPQPAMSSSPNYATSSSSPRNYGVTSASPIPGARSSSPYPVASSPPKSSSPLISFLSSVISPTSTSPVNIPPPVAASSGIPQFASSPRGATSYLASSPRTTSSPLSTSPQVISQFATSPPPVIQPTPQYNDVVPLLAHTAPYTSDHQLFATPISPPLRNYNNTTQLHNHNTLQHNNNAFDIYDSNTASQQYNNIQQYNDTLHNNNTLQNNTLQNNPTTQHNNTGPSLLPDTLFSSSSATLLVDDEVDPFADVFH